MFLHITRIDMQKQPRQNALLEIIESRSIGSQTGLAALLCERGFKVTQASISRDLDELGILKQAGKYVRPINPKTESDLGTTRFANAGDNLIVGRCSPGLASAITVKIDHCGISEIVGTIAGDDTIFIAVKDSIDRLTVHEKLAELFGRG